MRYGEMHVSGVTIRTGERMRACRSGTAETNREQNSHQVGRSKCTFLKECTCAATLVEEGALVAAIFACDCELSLCAFVCLFVWVWVCLCDGCVRAY
jgi:hypothetical protein